jgi:agmatine deiminase
MNPVLTTGTRTPLGCGFSMPAEWELQDSVWLSWPHDEDTFPELHMVKEAYRVLIRAISRQQVVHLLVRDNGDVDEVREYLPGKRNGIPKNLVLHTLDYADVWIRDYGPTFVVNRQQRRLAMVDWKFNAWGNKYPELLGDDRIPSLINTELQVPVFSPGIVLEGGSIDVNGKGTIMTTEQCLLNGNRNPELSKINLEKVLRDYLGISRIIWLKSGISGDDTDGHIDDVARFVDDRTVVCAVEKDRNDENYFPLKENFNILSNETDQAGRPLRVIPLPMPCRVGEDHRLPASYANFLITNNAVLFPVFGTDHDKKAKAVLAAAFPGRHLEGIDCTALVYGLGAIHCITQQQPQP